MPRVISIKQMGMETGSDITEFTSNAKATPRLFRPPKETPSVLDKIPEGNPELLPGFDMFSIRFNEAEAPATRMTQQIQVERQSLRPRLRTQETRFDDVPYAEDYRYGEERSPRVSDYERQAFERIPKKAQPPRSIFISRLKPLIRTAERADILTRQQQAMRNDTALKSMERTDTKTRSALMEKTMQLQKQLQKQVQKQKQVTITSPFESMKEPPREETERPPRPEEPIEELPRRLLLPRVKREEEYSRRYRSPSIRIKASSKRPTRVYPKSDLWSRTVSELRTGRPARDPLPTQRNASRFIKAMSRGSMIFPTRQTPTRRRRR